MEPKALVDFNNQCGSPFRTCMTWSPEIEKHTFPWQLFLGQETIVLFVRNNSSDRKTNRRPVVTNRGALHLQWNWKGVLRRGRVERWLSWSTKFGAQHVLGIYLAVWTLALANTEPDPSHYLGVSWMDTFSLQQNVDLRPKPEFRNML